MKTRFTLFTGALFSLFGVLTLAAMSVSSPVAANGGQGSVDLVLVPVSPTVSIGETFEIIIEAQACEQLVAGVQVFIDFNPTYFQVLDADAGIAGIQINEGSTLPNVLLNSVDNTTGTIDYSAGKLGEPFPCGNFIIATVEFQALEETAPSTSVSFSTTFPRETIVDYGGDDITGTITGSMVTVTPDAPIYLDPSDSEDICVTQTFTLEIKTNVDSEQPVAGVQAFLNFDSTYVKVRDADTETTGIQIEAGSDLPWVMANSVDNAAGTIDYITGVALTPPITYPTGTFTVAIIEFEALRVTEPTTDIAFAFDSPTRLTKVVYGEDALPGTHGDAIVKIIPGVRVDISVILQGGGRPGEGWVVPITINFFEPGADVLNDTPVYEFDLTTVKSDSKATCQCIGILPDTYDITVVSEHTLMNVRRDVVISVPSRSVDMCTLLEGNANDDNTINISDFGILAVSFMKSEGEEGYDARADFDRNGIIDIHDFGLLAVSFMITSPVDCSE